jgi:hypothetical protein
VRWLGGVVSPFGVVALAAILVTATPWGAYAEQAFGITGGGVLGLSQDVRVWEFDATGQPVALVDTRDTGVSAGPMGGLTYTLWGANLGVQVEGLYWRTTVDADRPGSGSQVRVEQDRVALLISVLGRLHFGEPGGIYGYLGAGAAVVWTGINPGQSEVGPGVGALIGIAFPLGPRLRLRLEARYLVTADVDAGNSGLQAEPSGNSEGNLGKVLFGPHLDTQFVPILVGLDWVF